MELNRLPDYELAKRMVEYIDRVTRLQESIARYLESTGYNRIQAEYIKEQYKQLKNELRKDADYLDLLRNRNGSELYKYVFTPSIREAAAWGFTVPVNSRIGQQMFSAVSEARYKLTKYYSLQKWIDLT